MKKRPTSCALCSQHFTPQDDIVICPECGAPYHRECYQKSGHCIFEEKHKDGFEYVDPNDKTEPNPLFTGGQQEGGKPNQTIACPRCQTVNDARNIFCEQCGAPLHAAQQHMPNQQTGQQMPPFFGGMMYNAMPGFDVNGELDGISLQDWSTYIGQSAPAYLPRMMVQEHKGSKTSFTLSAFFLGPFYFAYRKMWGWAAVALILWILAAIPGILQIMAYAGNPLIASLSAGTIDSLVLAANYVTLAVRILSGVFALYLYRKSAGKQIKALKEKAESEAQYRAALTTKGGPSIIGVVIIAVILFAISAALLPLIGQDVMAFTEGLYSGSYSQFL